MVVGTVDEIHSEFGTQMLVGKGYGLIWALTMFGVVVV